MCTDRLINHGIFQVHALSDWFIMGLSNIDCSPNPLSVVHGSIESSFYHYPLSMVPTIILLPLSIDHGPYHHPSTIVHCPWSMVHTIILLPLSIVTVPQDILLLRVHEMNWPTVQNLFTITTPLWCNNVEKFHQTVTISGIPGRPLL